MAEKKKVIANLKMVLPGGGASAAPPVGSILGAQGVNMMEFVNAFNEATNHRKGQTTPVRIAVYEDKSFTFTVSGTPVTELIKKAIGLDKGSAKSHKDKVGKITIDQIKQIAEEKMPDLNANSIEAAEKIVAGSARAMGVEVVE